MRTMAEYRANAQECRQLARLIAKPEDRTALERMAQTWEMLTTQRERDIERRLFNFAWPLLNA